MAHGSQDGERPRRRRIVLGYSDTGGGHRAAAWALAESIAELRPDVEIDLVDLFVQYAPKPFQTLPQVYTWMAQRPRTWKLTYSASNGEHRARAVNLLSGTYGHFAIRRFLQERPGDLYVSLHPLTNAPFLHAIRERCSPQTGFATVVTDLTTMSPVWFAKRSDLCIVPTATAAQTALRMGVDPRVLKVIGLPVSKRFGAGGTLAERRLALGWEADLPTIVLAGGADGVGPMAEVVETLAGMTTRVQIAVVTGRNDKLRQQLTQRPWAVPVHVYGFVDEMDKLMGAADVLVTKAGPGTLNEAFCTGLPIVIFHKNPGQEDGNVDQVVQGGAGVWAPTPPGVANTVSRWLAAPEERAAVAARSRALADPDAADEIARELLTLLDAVVLRTERVSEDDPEEPDAALLVAGRRRWASSRAMAVQATRRMRAALRP